MTTMPKRFVIVQINNNSYSPKHIYVYDRLITKYDNQF